MDMVFATELEAIIISMIRYLQKAIVGFPEVIQTTKACPAGNHLSNIWPDDEQELLLEEMVSQLHCTVAQLLFFCMRARPDIQVCMSFLTTIVQAPDKNNCGETEALFFVPQGYFIHAEIP